MGNDTSGKSTKEKIKEARKKCYSYSLDQGEVDLLAKQIGATLLESAIGFSRKLQDGRITLLDDCLFSIQCQRGGVDFECPSIFGAFDCAKFNCGGKGSDEFSCESGIFDDFECTNTFECGGGCGPFNCVGSFDDEDCEVKFCCDDKHFDCDAKVRFNTSAEEAEPTGEH